MPDYERKPTPKQSKPGATRQEKTPAPTPKLRSPVAARAPDLRVARTTFDEIRELATTALVTLQNVESIESVTARGPAHSQRDAIIANLSSQLERRLGVVLGLAGTLSPSDRVAAQASADLASAAVQAVASWVISRPVNGVMRSQFGPIEAMLNTAVTAVGATPTIARQHVAGRDSEVREAAIEDGQLELAKDRLLNSLDKFSALKLGGVGLFAGLVSLEEEVPMDLALEIGKAILVATLGHVAGAVSTLISTAVAKELGSVTAATASTGSKLISLLADVTTDSVQGLSGKIADGAFSQPQVQAAKTGRERLIAYYCAGLRSEVAFQTFAQKEAVLRNVARGRIAPSELDAVTRGVDAASTTVMSAHARNCALAFASSLVHQRLGTHARTPDPHNRKVSMIDETFFGAKDKFANRQGRHKSGDGMLVSLFSFQRGSQELKHTSTSLQGMNGDMLKLVLEGAGGDISQVWLPKEVRFRINNGDASASFVLDEVNQVQDSTPWETMAANTPYQSPHALWRAAHKLVRI